MQRVKGVVGTRVGYTQGHKESPTYTEVCSGQGEALIKDHYICGHYINMIFIVIHV